MGAAYRLDFNFNSLFSRIAALHSFSPVDGTLSGGTVVTLTGTGFEQLDPSNTTVLFGDVPCSLLW